MSLQGDILASQKTNLAFFKGSHVPDLLIVGEAPGRDENTSGVPFTGASGRMLEQYLSVSRLSGYRLAFLNAVFRMPLANDAVTIRKPSSGEIAHYRGMVEEILEYLSPRYVLLLGNTAAESVLRLTDFTEVRGRWIDNVYMTFHPAFIMRHPEYEGHFRAHFMAVAERFKSDLLNQSDDNKRVNEHLKRAKMITDEQKITAIAEQSEQAGSELKLIRGYITSDPSIAIAKSRKLLESVLNRHLPTDAGGLSDKIRQLAEDAPGSVITQMHTIRLNGNTALHSDEDLSPDIAKQTFEPLLSVLCWIFKIDLAQQSADSEQIETVPENEAPNNDSEVNQANMSESNLRVRFFVADGIYRTWPKIALLTDDGTLYCEYLAWNKLTIFKKEGLDFELFKPSDFSFGEKEHGKGYQHLREVSYQEAINFQLVNQTNWIERYMSEIGLEPPTS